MFHFELPRITLQRLSEKIEIEHCNVETVLIKCVLVDIMCVCVYMSVYALCICFFNSAYTVNKDKYKGVKFANLFFTVRRQHMTVLQGR